MSSLTIQSGQLVLRDGAIGTGEGCCCGSSGCSGRCNFQVNDGLLTQTQCSNGCNCVTHPCACFDSDENGTYPWYVCKTECGEPPFAERLAFAVCGSMADEQAGDALVNMLGWVGSVNQWMQDNGYTAVTSDFQHCTPLESEGLQNLMVVVYGCCPNGFNLDGQCLNVLDVEPAANDKPYSGSVVRYTVDGTNETAPDCVPPYLPSGFFVPPCAENPLP